MSVDLYFFQASWKYLFTKVFVLLNVQVGTIASKMKVFASNGLGCLSRGIYRRDLEGVDAVGKKLAAKVQFGIWT